MTGFRWNWVKWVLLAVLIVESSLLLGVNVQRYVGDYVQAYQFGGFQYGCSNLQASTVSNDSLIRWVRLTCPNGPAVRMLPNGDCGVKENPCPHVIPTYTSPGGLLGLYAVDHADPACPDNSHPYAGYLLFSGVGQVYGSWGFGATDIDYCAVTKASGGTMEGFSLQWSLGETTTLPPSFHSAVSASNVTVAHGGTAVFTMTVTSKPVLRKLVVHRRSSDQREWCQCLPTYSLIQSPKRDLASGWFELNHCIDSNDAIHDSRTVVCLCGHHTCLRCKLLRGLWLSLLIISDHRRSLRNITKHHSLPTLSLPLSFISIPLLL